MGVLLSRFFGLVTYNFEKMGRYSFFLCLKLQQPQGFRIMKLTLFAGFTIPRPGAAEKDVLLQFFEDTRARIRKSCAPAQVGIGELTVS